LQWAAVSCSELQYDGDTFEPAMCCSALQWVEKCCSKLQWIAVCCSMVARICELQWVVVSCSELQWVAVSCSMMVTSSNLPCVAVRCNGLKSVAVSCSVLQYGGEYMWVAVSCSVWIVPFAPLSWIRTCWVKCAHYGVTTTSRINKIICLLCRIASVLWGSFAKETYNFIDPTNQSHPS